MVRHLGVALLYSKRTNRAPLEVRGARTSRRSGPHAEHAGMPPQCSDVNRDAAATDRPDDDRSAATALALTTDHAAGVLSGKELPIALSWHP